MPDYLITDSHTTGLQCEQTNLKLSEPEKLFYPQHCYKHLNHHRPPPQFQYYDGNDIIYCHGHNITINGEEKKCPDYPIQISNSQNFSVNGFKHSTMMVKHTTVNSFERLVSNEIYHQIKLDSRATYGVNLTNLNQKFESLEQVKKFITEKVVLPKLDMSNFDMLKPFKDLFKWIGKIFEFVGIAIAVGIAVIATVVCAPVLQIVFMSLRLVKIPAKIIAEKIKNFSNEIIKRLRVVERKVEYKMEKKLNKQRRYWENQNDIKIV